MAISFSGLASGLDTSSWVESLVALKQAKIDTLEEQKETVLLSRETLNNIKSCASYLRTVKEFGERVDFVNLNKACYQAISNDEELDESCMNKIKSLESLFAKSIINY